jgi:hypothetical protein
MDTTLIDAPNKKNALREHLSKEVFIGCVLLACIYSFVPNRVAAEMELEGIGGYLGAQGLIACSPLHLPNIAPDRNRLQWTLRPRRFNGEPALMTHVFPRQLRSRRNAS